MPRFNVPFKLCTFNRLVHFLTIFLFVLLLFEYHIVTKDKVNGSSHSVDKNKRYSKISNDNFHEDEYSVEKFYKKRESWHTSNLGSIMFKNVDKSEFLRNNRENRTFVVFIWKYWNWLKKRHIYNFKGIWNDPLQHCSVKNCKFLGDFDKLNKTVESYVLSYVDAVVVHVQHGDVPEVVNRNVTQRWIFLSDESPKNSFSMAKSLPKLKTLANVFNWSMTYRSDSDVPVPYGRTVALSKPKSPNITLEQLTKIVPYWEEKRHDKLVSVLISNCRDSKRTEYLKKLNKHIEVDIHGKCATNKTFRNSCPGHFSSDCKLMKHYLFYLVFENSRCRQYLTEKGFYHAYSKGAIPIIMGPPKEDCIKLLPPNSYLHVDDYESPEDLANEIKIISRSDQLLLRFHLWRNKFEVLNEHGYFGTKSYHFCRVCEALNYNDPNVKVYDEDQLRLFLDSSLLCH